MPNPALPRQVRSILEGAPDALPLNDLLSLVDDFVLECTASDDADVQIYQLEEDLQSIYQEVVDYSGTQTEIFLAVLYHLAPILPSTSVISWFDLVLRPALRDPKLPTQAVSHAKELIITALQKTNEVYVDKIGDFRKRLVELYLLDAFNEGSNDDALEWADLSEEERAKRTHWKHNLEDILVKFGNERPEDLLNEIDRHFATPSARLQLLTLLNVFTYAPNFASAAKILPNLPLMRSLLLSLFLDNSSTACTLEVTLLVKLLPYFAVNARKELKELLPKLLAILARIMCWKKRRASRDKMPADEEVDVDFEKELERETNPLLTISPDIGWERLEMVFNVATSFPPQSRPYFTTLYYLYPSNLLRFLRNPAQYLHDNNITSPYVESWEQALDQNEIRRRSENLVREHNCHPLLIWRDAVVELTEPEFWSKYDISRIVSEAAMLDVRNLAVGLQGRYHPGDTSTSLQPLPREGPDFDDLPTRFLKPIDLSSGRAVISLQDMINTTVALKSNIDLQVIQPTSQWPQSIFSTTSTAPAEDEESDPVAMAVASFDQDPNNVAQAISGLQREILLLRNDLNFELWLSRENAKHIGRLYQDRILMRTAEAERQGLYNKLRTYRTQVTNLTNELHEQKQQTLNARSKYTEWTGELQNKLKELREEKRNWINEAAHLRQAEKDARALFEAQGKLLGDATKQVFDLSTQRKENQHKVDRLHDYERQIQQLVNVQKLFDADFAKFKDREQDLQDMQSRYRQMEMRTESLEKIQAESEERARDYRRQIQRLEFQLSETRRRAASPQLPFTRQQLDAFQKERKAWQEEKAKLQEENNELQEINEELQSMVEHLKGQVSGQGLMAAPRSPIITATHSHSYQS
ncbi:hypothetical protein CPC08DRAFT_703975 [Agrocybe pediades]|nr:hypothetical protein CPC08DRAFT_703975 [Agrocybe pediades]